MRVIRSRMGCAPKLSLFHIASQRTAATSSLCPRIEVHHRYAWEVRLPAPLEAHVLQLHPQLLALAHRHRVPHRLRVKRDDLAEPAVPLRRAHQS
eukprot:CAMPEP_0195637176 /NCGR_PEP_ID=MMETSP0815-20121206/24278_1 /TAXON_ID=97485 /ORGANISM="Prymnesium parvum, Strain Texoma1" /LENGTH=94 /DNA_ID=CAMNT_0040779365 /DNA_START=198 /DNA_END=479 /DNA_ORIENTATION=-